MDRYLTVAFWQDLWQDALRIGAARGLRILVILLLFAVGRRLLYRIIDAGLARVMTRQAARGGGEERTQRLQTLQVLMKSVAGYLLFFVLIVALLDAVTVDVKGLIATAGIGGVAVGFGAQKLVKDVISGFFLIMEDQFAVGDYISIGPATGTVEDIGMRITRLRDDGGRLWIVSNGDITIVTNHSRAPVESFIEIGIGPAADVKEAEEILNRTGEELAQDKSIGLMRAPKVLGVASYDATKTLLRVEVVSEPRNLTAVQLKVREVMRENLVAANMPVA